MKKLIILVLILGLVASLCACGEAKNIESQEDLPAVFDAQSSQGDESGQDTSSEKETQSSKVETSKPKSDKGTTAQNTKQKITFKNTLPKVYFSKKDGNVRYMDMVNLKDDGFAVCGYRNLKDYPESMIRFFDKNNKLVKEYTSSKGNGFEKMAACSDGGFIAASCNPPYVTKINSDFKTEWVKHYAAVNSSGGVQDVEEISPNCIAVLFVLYSEEADNKLQIAFLDKNGNLIETIDLMKNIDLQDADIIPDGKGGFYLVTSCDRTLAENFETVIQIYESRKESEVAVLKFSSSRKLVSATILGGDGSDWVEEAALDNNGNIYIAMGTNSAEKDGFWQMPVNRSRPYRRMLVKIDSKGKVIYKAPLSNMGMGVDWNFGIHIKDNKAYVVGLARYFDGYQEKYPCSQIPANEADEGWFAAYIVCFDKNGNEQGRSVFNCDPNTEPQDTVMLSDGTIKIAGLVSYNYNPFGLSIPESVDFAAAIFVHKN